MYQIVAGRKSLPDDRRAMKKISEPRRNAQRTRLKYSSVPYPAARLKGSAIRARYHVDLISATAHREPSLTRVTYTLSL